MFIKTRATEKFVVHRRYSFTGFSSRNTIKPLVVIVDDHEDSLTLAIHVLERMGFRCLSAKNAAEGLSILQSSKPNLVLLDIKLPDMSGFDVIQRIRQDSKLKQTPIIAVTALASVRDRENILEAGFTDYLFKPFKLDKLTEKVQCYLSKIRFITKTPKPIGAKHRHNSTHFNRVDTFFGKESA